MKKLSRDSIQRDDPFPGLTSSFEFDKSSEDAKIISTAIVMGSRSIERGLSEVANAISDGVNDDGLAQHVDRASRRVQEGLFDCMAGAPLDRYISEIASAIAEGRQQ